MTLLPRGTTRHVGFRRISDPRLAEYSLSGRSAGVAAKVYAYFWRGCGGGWLAVRDVHRGRSSGPGVLFVGQLVAWPAVQQRHACGLGLC